MIQSKHKPVVKTFLISVYYLFNQPFLTGAHFLVNKILVKVIKSLSGSVAEFRKCVVNAQQLHCRSMAS